jgi:hypothetical protein
MSLQVVDLTNHPKPKPGKYFFDTNVLIFVMGFSNNPAKETLYINFFNETYKAAIASSDITILTTSLQISELFNRLLKLESAKACGKQNYTKGEYSYFKDVFRKGTDIIKLFDQFKSDFLAYRDGFKLIPCPVNDFDSILDYSPSKTDINDHLYSQLVKSQDATMVTHDADLLCHDMKILTANQVIIKKSREFVIKV